METLHYLTFGLDGTEIVSSRQADVWHLTGPDRYPVVAPRQTPLATEGIPTFCVVAIVRDRSDAAGNLPANVGMRGGHDFHVPATYKIVRGHEIFAEEWLVVHDEMGTERFRINTAHIVWTTLNLKQ